MAKFLNTTADTSAMIATASSPSNPFHDSYLESVDAREQIKKCPAEQNSYGRLFSVEVTDELKSHRPSAMLDEWLATFMDIQLDDPTDEHLLYGMVTEIYYDRLEERNTASIPMDMDSLTPLNHAFIDLIANTIMEQEIQSIESLREAIGLLSETANACVFSDDPTVAECWQTVSIEKVGNSHRIYWQFDNFYTTLVVLASTSDGTLVVQNDILTWNECMQPDSEDLSSFLTWKSIEAVQAMVGNTPKMTM